MRRNRRGKRGGRRQNKPAKDAGTVLPVGAGERLPPAQSMCAPAQALSHPVSRVRDWATIPKDELGAAREYDTFLNELTLNTLHVTNDLAQIASENLNKANGIVTVVENRLNVAAPDCKLPLLYLIDAILRHPKSGFAYVRKFSIHPHNEFGRLYDISGPSVRAILLRTLNSWPVSGRNEFIHACTRLAREINRTSQMPLQASPVSSQIMHASHRTLPVDVRANASHLHNSQGQGLPNTSIGQVYRPTRQGIAYPNPFMAMKPAFTTDAYEKVNHAERLMEQLYTKSTSLGLETPDFVHLEQTLDSIIANGLRTVAPSGVRERYLALRVQLLSIRRAMNTNHVAMTPHTHNQLVLNAPPVVPQLNMNALSQLLRALPSMPTPAPVTANIPTTKPMIEFSAIRTTSHMFAVRALYGGVLRYHSASHGMRFATSEQLSNHLDWLFARNKKMAAKKNKSATFSRCWYDSVDQFTRGDGTANDSSLNLNGKLNAKTNTPSRNCAPVIAKAGEELCPVCGEGFPTSWSDDANAWVLRDCVRCDDGAAYHINCAKSADVDYGDSRSRSSADAQNETEKRCYPSGNGARGTKRPLDRQAAEEGNRRKAQQF